MSQRAPHGLRQAVAFLTPVGGAVAPGPAALTWFPIVGALIGLTVGAIWWAGTQAWTPLVGAVLATVADLACTGMLHFDGLCDAADGLLPPIDAARRLAVMASPEVGAFGVAAGAGVLLVRVACFSAVGASPVLIAALWAASRTAMAVASVGVPYVRPGGLASGFIPAESTSLLVRLAAVGVLGAGLLAGAWHPVVGPLAVGGVAVGSGATVWLARRRIGGYTGDVLGAAGVIGECVGLLVASARW